MSQNSSTRSGGIGFCGLLTILFIGLKLTHNIDWSWWWVLSPLWIPIAVVLAIFAVVFLGALVLWLIAKGLEAIGSKPSRRI